MFELTVEAEFCAAHALLIGGARETVHGHNWRVSATLGGSRLDADGLLVDFHVVERWLEAVIGHWRNADLNAAPEFAKSNPSAENVATIIAASLAGALSRASQAQDRVKVISVRITEAPGCSVTYRPPEEG